MKKAPTPLWIGGQSQLTLYIHVAAVAGWDHCQTAQSTMGLAPFSGWTYSNVTPSLQVVRMALL